MTLGQLELISLTDGTFRLDGGAMFGVVPKPLWEQHAPTDSRNRIRLAMRPLIVRGTRTMIIDAGVGDKMPPKLVDIYGIERERHLDHALAEAGLSENDIDIVLASHLHFDHAGGFTRRDQSGQLRPRFPKAQYIVRRGEWEDATAPTDRTRASYLAENFKPLADAGVLQLVDDDVTIMPGVRVRRTGGHTRHHQMILIESEGRTAVFVADFIPTTAHGSLGDGIRPLSGGHDYRQTGIHPRGDCQGVPDLLRTRSGNCCRGHQGQRQEEGGRAGLVTREPGSG
jgi:glyoxylase-like metal-dependent hydrolase (beta-lactamase superfamily II)